jgi:hypothetical protein
VKWQDRAIGILHPPPGFVADLLSQALRSRHDRDVEVGGGFAGPGAGRHYPGVGAPWQARPDSGGHGLGFSATRQARPEVATDGMGLAGVARCGMGGNGAGDFLRL